MGQALWEDVTADVGLLSHWTRRARTSGDDGTEVIRTVAVRPPQGGDGPSGSVSPCRLTHVPQSPPRRPAWSSLLKENPSTDGERRAGRGAGSGLPSAPGPPAPAGRLPREPRQSRAAFRRR